VVSIFALTAGALYIFDAGIEAHAVALAGVIELLLIGVRCIDETQHRPLGAMMVIVLAYQSKLLRSLNFLRYPRRAPKPFRFSSDLLLICHVSD
jgi:hypothetical protein